MAWSEAIVTNSGLNLFTEALALGKGIEIVEARGGSTTVPLVTLINQTDVTPPRVGLSVVGIEAVENAKRAIVRAYNIGVETEYTLRLIGLFARIKDTENPFTLLAVIQDADGEKIPTEEEIPEFVVEFGFIIPFSNELEITLNVDTSVLATKAELLEHTENTHVHITEEKSAEWDGKQSAEVTLADEAGSTTLPPTSGKIVNILQGIRNNLKILFSYFTNGVANAAAKLNTARTIRTNLGSSSAASFDGSENVTPGVQGTLTIENGGTGATDATNARTNLAAAPLNTTLANNAGSTTLPTTTSGTLVSKIQALRDNVVALFGYFTNGVANLAIRLNTARTIRTNLGSTSAASFDGSANAEPGVSGVLGIVNGGTGANTAAGARANLDVTPGNIGAAPATFTLTDAAASTTLPPTTAATPQARAQSLRNNVRALFSYFTNGVANLAIRLNTARTIRTNLASTAAANFDGTENATPGVTGTLPLGNGGTGVTTAAALSGLIVETGVATSNAAVSLGYRPRAVIAFSDVIGGHANATAMMRSGGIAIDVATTGVQRYQSSQAGATQSVGSMITISSTGFTLANFIGGMASSADVAISATRVIRWIAFR